MFEVVFLEEVSSCLLFIFMIFKEFAVSDCFSILIFVRLNEVNDVVRHLIVTYQRDVLHLVVDDDWCDVMLFLEDFGCLGGEGCGGMVGGEVIYTGNGKIAHRITFLGQRYERLVEGKKTKNVW